MDFEIGRFLSMLGLYLGAAVVLFLLLRLAGLIRLRSAGRAHLFVWALAVLVTSPFWGPVLMGGLDSGGAATAHALMSPLFVLLGGGWLVGAYGVIHSIGRAELMIGRRAAAAQRA